VKDEHIGDLGSPRALEQPQERLSKPLSALDVRLCSRSASWVQGQIGHADMTTMQRYYLQASRSEIQPRIERLIEQLLGEADASDGARDDGPRGEDE
jgi:hypothetical protein